MMSSLNTFFCLAIVNRVLKTYFWVAVLFFAREATATSQAIIISGGSEQRFELDSKAAYETNVRNGRDTYVFAADGKWDWVAPGHGQDAKSIDRLEQLIKNASGKLNPGESLVIYVTDHGDAPNSFNEPLSGQIVLSGSKESKTIRYDKLTELIKKYVPASNPVKLVGNHCFSGGLHEVSFQLPNVCSSANTDFRTVSYGNGYAHSFWNAEQKRKGASLFDLHTSALEQDKDNPREGQLSSIAYVDSVLKRNSYDENNYGSWVWRLLTGVWPTDLPKDPVAIDRSADCKVKASDFDAIKELADNLNATINKIDRSRGIDELMEPTTAKIYKDALNNWDTNKR